jgi:enoyl-CoA hydratase
MAYETIICEKEEKVAIVTLNRPDRLNAISNNLAVELEAVFKELDRDENVRAVILTGAGRAFCAGRDIKEMSETKPPLIRSRTTFFEVIENTRKPVLAAINGPAIGGGLEIALVCDFRIASEAATFGFGEVKIGVMPMGGGTVRVPRLTGVGKAKELLYFGNQIDAQEAYRIGLANKVVPAANLIAEVSNWARELAARPPIALQMLKAMVNVGMQINSLVGAFEFEQKCGSLLLQTEDSREGIRAFADKRKPLFRGR